MNDTEREVTHAVQFHTLYGIFPIVLFTYFCIPFKLRKIWLLIASYYFYMSWNPKYALLIGGSTLITYTCGILIEKCDCFSSCSGLKWKKVVLGLGIVSNFTILGIFKYGNFVIETINNVLQFCYIRVVDCRLEFHFIRFRSWDI